MHIGFSPGVLLLAMPARVNSRVWHDCLFSVSESLVGLRWMAAHQVLISQHTSSLLLSDGAAALMHRRLCCWRLTAHIALLQKPLPPPSLTGAFSTTMTCLGVFASSPCGISSGSHSGSLQCCLEPESLFKVRLPWY